MKSLRAAALLPLLAGVVVALTTLTASRAQAAPEVSHFTLANGLEVVIIPDRRTPVVTHMVWYKVGAADEEAGKSGIAHFLEHLMFKGTAKNPAGRFSKAVAALGGQENAFTSADYTSYFQRTAREHLEALMTFEADRMSGLVLTDDNVLPERDVVLEEWNMRVANSPDARLGEQMSAALYVNHPYGRPVIGWRHEIEKLDRADAMAFYRRFYGPNNAILVITGDVTAEEVKGLCDKTYGKVPRVAGIPPRVRTQEPPPIAPRQVTLADPRVAQPAMHRAYLVPSFRTGKPDAEALELLAFILGNGTTSRLYRDVVVARKLATDAGGWYSGSTFDSARFGVFATPQPGKTFAEVEAAIDGVIADLVKDGVTEEELDRAKSRMIAEAVYAQDNQALLARWYGAALATGSTVEDVLSWPDRVRAVTLERVHKAARTWLDRRRSVTGYLVKNLPGTEEKRS